MGEGRLKTPCGLRVDRAKLERRREDSGGQKGNGRNARREGCPWLVGLFLPCAAVIGKLLIAGVLMRRALTARHAVRRGGLPSGTGQRDGDLDRQDCEQQRGEGSAHSDILLP
jgi:hypothetical protein